MPTNLGYPVVSFVARAGTPLFFPFPQVVPRTLDIRIIVFRELTHVGPCARHRRDQRSIERVYENRLYEGGRGVSHMFEEKEKDCGIVQATGTALQDPMCRVGGQSRALDSMALRGTTPSERLRGLCTRARCPSTSNHDHLLVPTFTRSLVGEVRKTSSNIPYPTPSYPRGISYPANGTTFALFST